MLTLLSSFLTPIASITHTTLRICLNTGKFHQKKKKATNCNTGVFLLHLEIGLLPAQQSWNKKIEKVYCRKTVGRVTRESFQTAPDSSREYPLVARAADRVWAAALPSVTDLSANSSKLAGSQPHSTLLYFSIQSLHAKQLGDKIASTFKNTVSDPKHFAAKAALLPAGISGNEVTRNPAWA